MTDGDNNGVVRLESAQETLKKHFLGWQCRLRQHAMRHLQGRPSPGLCPDIVLKGAGKVFESAPVLLVLRQPQTTTAELRHMVKRTLDPKQRYSAALAYFSAGYYQETESFSDRITALFGPGSRAAAALLEEGCCELRFEEKGQRYDLPAAICKIPHNDPAWEATFWHNSLFNPALPGDITILGFMPDWAQASADPPAY